MKTLREKIEELDDISSKNTDRIEVLEQDLIRYFETVRAIGNLALDVYGKVENELARTTPKAKASRSPKRDIRQEEGTDK